MSTASRYNLHFHIWELPNSGTKKPSIGVALINGEPINHEIASFLEPNGIQLTEGLINDIHSLDPDSLVEGYNLWGGNEDESVEIKGHPPRAVLNTGGREVEVPLADFLQLLQEWKTYLQSIPDPHWLSNR